MQTVICDQEEAGRNIDFSKKEDSSQETRGKIIFV